MLRLFPPEKLEKKLNTMQFREREEKDEAGRLLKCQTEFSSSLLTTLAPNTYMQEVYSNGYSIICSYPSVGSLVSNENLCSEK
jgi:DNA phosphorothioation-dependent restriction protein DptG